tara:strand:+ start:1439 stop:1903 length:465 start_codon:yes stop_codon:yes gene_type:complete
MKLSENIFLRNRYMITINDLIDLYDDFFKTDKRLPSIVPKNLKGNIMKWDIRVEFSDKVHTWKDKKPIRDVITKDDIDRYWIATELALTLNKKDRNLIYDRHRGNSYRKLAKLYNVSYETVRLNYLAIIFGLQENINRKANGNLRHYINLSKKN